jgi:mannose/cellobiose epimerase-like protein (N-acyl-D-glucosamine 2-epimerase family)
MVDTTTFRSHMESVLRFWQCARDDEEGGFQTWISSDGTVHRHGSKELLTHGRLLYNYAEGMRVGMSFCAGEAEHIYDFMRSKLLADEGWYHSLRRGKVHPPQGFSTYLNLFAVIGMARYAQASGRADVLDEAWRLFRLLEEHTVEEPMAVNGVLGMWGNGGHRLPIGTHTGNTNLHFLEALGVLRDAGLEEDLTPRVAEMRTFFLDHILDKEGMFTFDHFRGDYKNPWRGAGTHISLAHGLEWLMFFRAFPGHELDASLERGLLDSVMKKGVHDDGFLADEFFLTERRTAGPASFWPQVEAVLAYNLGHVLYGEPYGRTCRLLADFYFKHFVDTDGVAFQWIDRNGVVLKRRKGDYWKMGYHAVRMCMEVMSLAGGAFDGNAEEAE